MARRATAGRAEAIELDVDEHHPRRLGLNGFDLKNHDDIIQTIIGDRKERRHHGFILSGPKGVGKASTAFRLAEFLFAKEAETGLFGDETLKINDEDPDVKLVRAGSHPDLMVVEADTTKATAAITVDQIRSIIPFLAHTPSRGGWRVVIIDALDEMNISGANAMLKTLEEPPEKAIILIINHGAKPVLPTIRSRAQFIRFNPLGHEDTRQIISRNFLDADPNWVDVAAVLSDGAPGKASLLASSGVVDLYAETCTLFSQGNVDMKDIDALAAQWGAGGAKNADRRQLARLMMDRLLTRAARQSAGNTAALTSLPSLDIEEKAITALLGKHSANELAELHSALLSDLDYADRVNLDVGQVMFNAFAKLAKN